MADLRRAQQLIHAACRELGIDAETRREMQLAATGKPSMAEMDARDLAKVRDALVAKGWKPKAKARAAETRPDLRFIWVLWGKLAEAGVGGAKPGREALRKFINSDRWWQKYGYAQTDVSLLSEERARDVIEALKAVAVRNGISLERPKP